MALAPELSSFDLTQHQLVEAGLTFVTGVEPFRDSCCMLCVAFNDRIGKGAGKADDGFAPLSILPAKNAVDRGSRF